LAKRLSGNSINPAVEYVRLARRVYLSKVKYLDEDYDVIVTPGFGGRQLQITNLTGHQLCTFKWFNAPR
jgi:hypothetical protein